MESSADLVPLTDLSCFMLITPIPEIVSDIDFYKLFGSDTSEMEFLHEARKELKVALTESLGNMKLCINTATAYLDRLMAVTLPIKSTKIVIQWRRIFTDLGSQNVKVQIKQKSHLKVEIYMVSA